MYDSELNRIIMESKNISVIKVYNKLIHMEQIKGGIISNKKFLADELGLSIQSVCSAIRMLEASGYVTETKFNGQTQFILNHVVSQNPAEKPAEPAEKVEKQENNQPKPTVIRKGGKTITRMEIPDF